MRVNSRGQITIPKAIRDQLGLLPGTEIDFVMDGDSVRLAKAAKRTGESRGELALRHLRAAGPLAMSTDEILALTRGA